MLMPLFLEPLSFPCMAKCIFYSSPPTHGAKETHCLHLWVFFYVFDCLFSPSHCIFSSDSKLPEAVLLKSNLSVPSCSTVSSRLLFSPGRLFAGCRNSSTMELKGMRYHREGSRCDAEPGASLGHPNDSLRASSPPSHCQTVWPKGRAGFPAKENTIPGNLVEASLQQSPPVF